MAEQNSQKPQGDDRADQLRRLFNDAFSWAVYDERLITSAPYVNEKPDQREEQAGNEDKNKKRYQRLVNATIEHRS